MKDILSHICLAAALALTLSAAGCGGRTNVRTALNQERTAEAPEDLTSEDLLSTATAENPPAALPEIRITAGGSTFTGHLYDNDAARELMERLPLELDMSELNGNEKYYNLPEVLPTAPEPVGDIRAGDIMLYGSDCLVLFYEDFQTPYSYTRLGYVEDSSGLAQALGSGDLTVSLEAVEGSPRKESGQSSAKGGGTD